MNAYKLQQRQHSRYHEDIFCGRYHADEDISDCVKRLCRRGSHGKGQSTSQHAHDELHDSQVVEDVDDCVEENDDGQNLLNSQW